MAAFPAIIGLNAHTLILGSMPGVRSLQQQQYYAHPRNAFWYIMGQWIGFSEDEPYVKRCDVLIDNGVGVWDVLHDCERPGSLDSRIVLASEQPNDFRDLFNRYSRIHKVAFNGRAARTIFERHWRCLYAEFPNIKWIDLPSTSPAYAAMSVEQKKQIWLEKLVSR